MFVTSPDYVYEALERWSNQQGRSLANFGAFLIEVAIVKALKEGEISPPSEKPPTNPPRK
ncbi:ribbon-helix-helix domain-containing protein [Phormidesmis sp. 146-12]